MFDSIFKELTYLSKSSIIRYDTYLCWHWQYQIYNIINILLLSWRRAVYSVWTIIIIFRLNPACHKLSATKAAYRCITANNSTGVPHYTPQWIVGYTSLWILLRNRIRKTVHPVWVMCTVCILQTWDTRVYYLAVRKCTLKRSRPQVWVLGQTRLRQHPLLSTKHKVQLNVSFAN